MRDVYIVGLLISIRCTLDLVDLFISLVFHWIGIYKRRPAGWKWWGHLLILILIFPSKNKIMKNWHLLFDSISYYSVEVLVSKLNNQWPAKIISIIMVDYWSWFQSKNIYSQVLTGLYVCAMHMIHSRKSIRNLFISHLSLLRKFLVVLPSMCLYVKRKSLRRCASDKWNYIAWAKRAEKASFNMR